MKKALTLIAALALLLSLSVPVRAEGEHFSVDGDVVTLRDDGTSQAYENFIFFAPVAAVLLETDAVSLFVDSVRVGNLNITSDFVAKLYEASVGEQVTLVTVNLTVANVGTRDFNLDPAQAVLVTGTGEQVCCLHSMMAEFDPLFLTGAEQSGSLTFKCVKSPAETLETFRLHLPAATDDTGTVVGGPFDLYFALDKEYMEPVDPSLTREQQLAAWAARNILRGANSSRAEIIDSLVRLGRTEEDAAVGVDFLQVDWNAVAVGRAQSALKLTFDQNRKEALQELLKNAGFAESEIEYAIEYLKIQ